MKTARFRIVLNNDYKNLCNLRNLWIKCLFGCGFAALRNLWIKSQKFGAQT